MLKILFLLLMSGGIPVAIAMAGASLIYLFWTQSSPPFVVIHRMVSGIDSFPLLAVPFFILAGNLMNNAGITNRIYNFALASVGWMKGGLGHVNVVGSVVFAGMSGTAIADAAGLGTIEIKAMKDHGYSTEFAVGVTAASATLGPIIPPSLPFVIYGMMANVSVGSLFLAGILPGVLMAFLMMVTVAYFAHKNNWGADVKFEWPRVLKALAETGVVIGWPIGVWGLVTLFETPPQLTVFVALGFLFIADKLFKFQAVLPIMTPVLLIGHDHRRIHTDRRRHCSLCLGHHSRIFLVSHAELQNVCEDLLGHRRNNGHRHVHCGGRQHLWLDAHGHWRHSGHQRLGLGIHARALEVFVVGQFAHVVCGLLLRAHSRHYHPSSHIGSHLPKAGYRLGALWLDHGA